MGSDFAPVWSLRPFCDQYPSLTSHRSSAVAYKYGVSGPFWYASGATVQVLLFATLAIELKRRSPNAHTFLEVIKARYGPATHGVYIVFGLVTNILVTAMLLTGGSAVVSDLTGVPTAAACFLLPVGTVCLLTSDRPKGLPTSV